jgi:type I restriction enzyme M protein
LMVFGPLRHYRCQEGVWTVTILPLVILKRLSDVFDDKVEHLAAEFGDPKTAAKLVEQDHKLVRFYVPPKTRWAAIAQKTTGLREHLTDTSIYSP